MEILKRRLFSTIDNKARIVEIKKKIIKNVRNDIMKKTPPNKHYSSMIVTRGSKKHLLISEKLLRIDFP